VYKSLALLILQKTTESPLFCMAILNCRELINL
jgi:hypothetical protein